MYGATGLCVTGSKGRVLQHSGTVHDLHGVIDTALNTSQLRAAKLTLTRNDLHNVFLEDRCEVASDKRT